MNKTFQDCRNEVCSLLDAILRLKYSSLNCFSISNWVVWKADRSQTKPTTCCLQVGLRCRAEAKLHLSFFFAKAGKFSKASGKGNSSTENSLRIHDICVNQGFVGQ